MNYMVMLVLDDINSCPAVLEAWEKAGTHGITIIESTGLGRMRRAVGMRNDLPLMPSLRYLLQSREERHRTLISVVESEEVADNLIKITEVITGNLSAPNKGVLFVLPVLKAVGIANHRKEDAEG
ncbi:MAG: P-II family nitrogen regulator [Ardenticatenaceae bacterium]|nr:P-II family nitrogen regulator [Ardenticatenaceae bacterium]